MTVARGAALLAALWCGSVSEARAQAAAEPSARKVSFTWRVEPAAMPCASQHELEVRVAARLAREAFAAGSARSLEGRVSGRPGGRGRVATLRLRDRQGASLGERTFESSDVSCESLEDAAVLAIALLIDPDAALAPPPAAPPAPGGAGATTAAPGETRMVLVPVPVPVAVPSRPAPETPRRDPRPVRAAVAVPLTVAAGPLPRVAVGTGLLVDLELARGAHVTAAFSWLPSVSTGDGELSFSLITAAMGACVEPWSRWRWALGVCAGLRAGAIDAVSHRLTPIETGEQPWLELDASLRATAQPIGPLWIGLEAGPTLVALRPRFRVVGRDGAALEPSRVGATASAWAGVRFP